MTEKEIGGVVERCAAAWIRRGYCSVYSRDDLLQEGWVIALEALPRAERAGAVDVAAYVGRAVILGLGNSIAWWDALTTLPQGDGAPSPRHAAPFKRRASVRAAELLPAPSRAPDVEGLTAEAEAKLRAELRDLAGRLNETDRAIVADLLGFTGEPLDIADAAAARGVDVRRVYGARRELVRRGKESPALRRAWEAAA
jgi:hypothetical protein